MEGNLIFKNTTLEKMENERTKLTTYELRKAQKNITKERQ